MPVGAGQEKGSAMKQIATPVSMVLLASPLALGGCQSSTSSGSGLEDGSAVPETDIVVGNEGPDGPPDACDEMSEGTSTTLDCP